mgnify:CR=1 FL=1
MCHSEYWNPRYETMSRDELVALQSQRLSSQLHRAYEKNEYFRKKLDAHGVHPDDVRTIEDLPKLPFMTKDDFRQNYPLGMCLSPREELREFHMSSGSTGTPVSEPKIPTLRSGKSTFSSSATSMILAMYETTHPIPLPDSPPHLGFCVVCTYDRWIAHGWLRREGSAERLCLLAGSCRLP